MGSTCERPAGREAHHCRSHSLSCRSAQTKSAVMTRLISVGLKSGWPREYLMSASRTFFWRCSVRRRSRSSRNLSWPFMAARTSTVRARIPSRSARSRAGRRAWRSWRRRAICRTASAKTRWYAWWRSSSGLWHKSGNPAAIADREQRPLLRADAYQRTVKPAPTVCVTGPDCRLRR